MIRFALLLPLWALALWGSLMIGKLPGDWGHSICGPWGCGPPTKALVSVHTAWVVLILPLTAILLPRLSAAVTLRIGVAMLAVGFGAIGLIAYRESTVWAAAAGDSAAEYLPQRIGFVIATSVDAPVVQVAAAGLVATLVSLFAARSGGPGPSDAQPGSAYSSPSEPEGAFDASNPPADLPDARVRPGERG